MKKLILTLLILIPILSFSQWNIQTEKTKFVNTVSMPNLPSTDTVSHLVGVNSLGQLVKTIKVIPDKGNCQTQVLNGGYFIIDSVGKYIFSNKTELMIDAQRYLSTYEGYNLLGVAHTIRFIDKPFYDINIDKYGIVSQFYDGCWNLIDTIATATFQYPDSLSISDNCYLDESSSSGTMVIGTPRLQNTPIQFCGLGVGSDNSPFKTVGNNIIQKDTTKYVGIGTTNPTEKLDIDGNIKTNNVFAKNLLEYIKISLDSISNDTSFTVPAGYIIDQIAIKNLIFAYDTIQIGESKEDEAGSFIDSLDVSNETTLPVIPQDRNYFYSNDFNMLIYNFNWDMGTILDFRIILKKVWW